MCVLMGGRVVTLWVRSVRNPVLSPPVCSILGTRLLQAGSTGGCPAPSTQKHQSSFGTAYSVEAERTPRNKPRSLHCCDGVKTVGDLNSLEITRVLVTSTIEMGRPARGLEGTAAGPRMADCAVAVLGHWPGGKAEGTVGLGLSRSGCGQR